MNVVFLPLDYEFVLILKKILKNEMSERKCTRNNEKIVFNIQL